MTRPTLPASLTVGLENAGAQRFSAADEPHARSGPEHVWVRARVRGRQADQEVYDARSVGRRQCRLFENDVGEPAVVEGLVRTVASVQIGAIFRQERHDYMPGFSVLGTLWKTSCSLTTYGV